MKQTTTVMKQYEIEIQETLTLTLPVIAESLDAALERIEEAYSCGEIELAVEGHHDVTFKQI